jgi:hypothetical protein
MDGDALMTHEPYLHGRNIISAYWRIRPRGFACLLDYFDDTPPIVAAAVIFGTIIDEAALLTGPP